MVHYIILLNDIPGIFSLVYVYAGRVLPGFLYTTGHLDGMGFAPLASGFMVQRFCDYGGIYYRDFSQQSDALARMGLQ